MVLKAVSTTLRQNSSKDELTLPEQPLKCSEPVTQRPRTDLYAPNAGIRLLPWVSHGQALLGPRVKHMGWRQPLIGQSIDARPGHAVFLAAPLQRAPPQIDDVMPVRADCVGVGRHCVVGEVSRDHRPWSARLWWRRRRISSLISRRAARMRSRRVWRRSRKAPRREGPQMNVNPRS